MHPVHRAAALPWPLRYPRGGDLELRWVIDEALPLDELAVAFAARPRFGGSRPITLWTAGEEETALTVEGQTVSLRVPAADIEALQAAGGNAWRLDLRSADPDALALRVQGDIDWLAPEGVWGDRPAARHEVPELLVSLAESGAVEVTVTVLSAGEDGGAVEIDNEAVNAAILEDAAASRTALGLGSAATTAASAYATAAQGALAASAVQPGTRPNLAGLDLAVEWDDSGTTYHLDDADVNDTASGANSTLLRRQVGGETKFEVRKNGGIRTTDGLYRIRYVDGAASWDFMYGDQPRCQVGLYGMFIESGMGLAWSSSGTNHAVGRDLGLFRASAGRARFTTAASQSAALGDLELRSLFLDTLLVYGESTVATLPTASANPRAWIEVVDADSPAEGSPVASGGSARCLVRSDGTNWIVRELL